MNYHNYAENFQTEFTTASGVSNLVTQFSSRFYR